jgi:gluconolactonase
MAHLMRRYLLLALVVCLAVSPAVATPSGGRPSACRGWQVRTLIANQGWLEDLSFDGRGGITLSALTQGRILRFSKSGRLSTVLRSLHAPGGQQRIGRFLYFVTGDTVTSAATGTIVRLDLRTGRHSTWARGLTAPNALVFLPDGDAVVSRDSQSGTGLTRIPARRPRRPQLGWAPPNDTNGLAVDPSGRWLYTDRTFSSDGEVDRISIAHPRRVQVIGRLGSGVFPDDMTLGPRGALYIAGFASDKIYRLDPRTHLSCAIASGIQNPTSLRFAGAGWPAGRLFVTDATGHLSELTPPR